MSTRPTGDGPPAREDQPRTEDRPRTERPTTSRPQTGRPTTGRPPAGRPTSGRPTGGGARSTGGRSGAGGPSRSGQAGPVRAERAPLSALEQRRKDAASLVAPDDADPRELDADVRRALRGLPAETADKVARHLVAAGRLVDDDPDAAYAHAAAARAIGGRIGLIREAAGIAAYRAGRFPEALAELRAARRMTGSDEHLPLMADAERGLGRPDKALALARSPEVARLGPAGQVEMLIVASGARRDLGQDEAAVVALQSRWLDDTRSQPWSTRLWYAYADALLTCGRRDEAVTWFTRAADADRFGETDADERLAELTGTAVLWVEDGDDDEDEDEVGAADPDHARHPGGPEQSDPAPDAG